jgi:hypothetical protein
MIPEGFEPAIPASERPQTHALDGAAIGIGASKEDRGIKFSPSFNTHKSHYTVAQFGAVTMRRCDNEC